MSFYCPMCQAGSLEITASIELPADLVEWSDELSLQVVACAACGFRGGATYEESRRGSGESVHHCCFRAEAEGLDRVEALIRACPDRSDARCTCPSHQALSARDSTGKWQPPIRPPGYETFPFRFV